MPLSNKRKQTTDTHSTLDESQNHYAAWKKWDTGLYKGFQLKKLWYIYAIEYCHNKEQILVSCSEADEPRASYTE